MMRLISRRAAGVAAFVAMIAATGCQESGVASPAETASPSAAAQMEVAFTGDFHAVDAEASGVAELVVLPDGSYEIILEEFSIADADGLSVALAMNRDVTSSADVSADEILELGALSGTTGMQVYPVPAEMSGGVMDYHSVLIWDGEMGHVIAAAPLSQP
jgi:hypothetical protein